MPVNKLQDLESHNFIDFLPIFKKKLPSELDQKFLEVSHALMTIGNFLLLLLQVIAIDQQSYLLI